MKKFILLTLLILLKIGVYGQQKPKQDFQKLKWLSGDWIRTNGKPGHKGYESWKVISPSKLVGEGVTIKGTDTVFFEKMELLTKGNDIFFTAIAKGDPNPTFFKLTSISNSGFVCENPEHDFPKKIAYTLKDKKIYATISGDGHSVDFIFIKRP